MEHVHSRGRGDKQEATPSTQSHLKFVLRHSGYHSRWAKASPVAIPCHAGAGGNLLLSLEAQGREAWASYEWEDCPEQAPVPRPAGITSQSRENRTQAR